MSSPAPIPRRIAVIGSGGVGGLLAALLARTAHEVTMLARGAALAAIRDRGIIVRGPDGESTAHLARVADDPAALGIADIVLVTVKAWQLAELGPRLAPLIGERTLVVPMQNGVEASEILARSVGEAHAIGGVCLMIGWAERPGEIRWVGAPPSLVIGALRPDQREAVAACAEAIRAGGIGVQVADDVARARWVKFLFVSPYAAVGAAERKGIGAVRSDPAARGRLEAAMREIAALAAARGVALPGDAVASAMQRIDSLPPDAITSMHRDVIEGRPSELEELIGAVVRLGRESGVATPVSAALYAQLEPLERAARDR